MTHFKPSIENPFEMLWRAGLCTLSLEQESLTRSLCTLWEGVWFMHGIQGGVGKFDKIEYNIYVHVHFSGEGAQSFLSAFQSDT